MISKLLAGLLFAAALGTSAVSQAQTLSSVDRGWYDINGIHQNANPNYIAGALQGGSPNTADVRNFFVFDLGSVTGTITSARLHLWNPADDPTTTTVNESGFRSTPMGNSPDRTETYQVNDVTTNINDLLAGNLVLGDATGIARYNDLGNGSIFGSYAATNADNGTFIDIVLNDAALSALNAGLGGLFAFGGSIVTLDALIDNTEALFRFTGFSGDTQLILTTSVTPVPEPEIYAMMAAGLGLLAFARRRKQATS